MQGAGRGPLTPGGNAENKMFSETDKCLTLETPLDVSGSISTGAYSVGSELKAGPPVMVWSSLERR